MVDAGDSKSPAARRAGSIPAPGTTDKAGSFHELPAFFFFLWEVALTSARTCDEVCRNPGVCGGTNGGTFWKSGGTSLHVPPTRAAQAGALVLVGCLMTPAARHYPPGWPGHNLTPLGRVTQQCAGAARITRTAQSQGEPTSGGTGVHRPPSTPSKRDALAHRWGSNYPHCGQPGRTRTGGLRLISSGGYPFFAGDTGDKQQNRM